MREDVIRSRNCSISGFLRAQIEKCSIVKTKTNKKKTNIKPTNMATQKTAKKLLLI